MARHPNVFATSVSHTTRSPRPGEVPGEDYHYVSMEEFEKLIADGGFVEQYVPSRFQKIPSRGPVPRTLRHTYWFEFLSAKFGGNRYGTSRQTITDILSSGKVPILDIEMEGVKQIKSLPASSSLNARYIFIAPPSTASLEARLRGRGTEKEESIQKRLAQAIVELEFAKGEGVHDLVVVNDDKERACDELEAWIFGKK